MTSCRRRRGHEHGDKLGIYLMAGDLYLDEIMSEEEEGGLNLLPAAC